MQEVEDITCAKKKRRSPRHQIEEALMKRHEDLKLNKGYSQSSNKFPEVSFLGDKQGGCCMESVPNNSAFIQIA